MFDHDSTMTFNMVIEQCWGLMSASNKEFISKGLNNDASIDSNKKSAKYIIFHTQNTSENNIIL
tara:strand:- start:443 stop:634 length:192 start_codon:yes stop_codon:yes gene_type:complete